MKREGSYEVTAHDSCHVQAGSRGLNDRVRLEFEIGRVPLNSSIKQCYTINHIRVLQTNKQTKTYI